MEMPLHEIKEKVRRDEWVLPLSQREVVWSDEFKKFRDSLSKGGFWFDSDFFVRCLSAVSMEQGLTKKLITTELFKAKDIGEDWKITQEGIEKTTDFLRTTLNLGSNMFLEAENNLVPIVVLFSKRASAVKNKMNRLAYWFLIAYLNQRFSGHSTATLNKDIKTVLESDDPVNGLLKNLEEEGLIFSTAPKDIRGNHMKFILYCLFKSLRTRDFLSGFGIESVSAHKSNRLDLHHIFADAILKNSAFKDKKEDIANKTFLTNRSNKELSDADPTYLSEYKTELLAGHLIPGDQGLWKLEQYEKFLAERRTLISRELNKFLTGLKESAT